MNHSFLHLLLILLTTPALTFGYIDPGAGYLLLQLLSGIFFGVLFFWIKVPRLLKRLLFQSPGEDKKMDTSSNEENNTTKKTRRRA